MGKEVESNNKVRKNKRKKKDCKIHSTPPGEIHSFNYIKKIQI